MGFLPRSEPACILSCDGLKAGREEGIQAMVYTLRELSIEKAIIVQKLAARFDLLPDAAEQKVEKYWKQ